MGASQSNRAAHPDRFALHVAGPLCLLCLWTWSAIVLAADGAS